MNEEKLITKDKDIVVPGEILAQGMSFLPGTGTYRLGNNVLANRLGLLTVEGKVLKTVPLAGRYIPKRGDVIIGKIIDILMSGWRLEINSPYSAIMPIKDASFSYIARNTDLTKFFKLEDYAVVKITNVSTQKLIDVTCKEKGLFKLKGGRIIYVNTHKVPRIIGKKGSMVSLIKKATDCKVIVGQNGVAWISGEPAMEVIAADTIKMIEVNAHISGLTDKIKSHLEKVTGRKIEEDTFEDAPMREPAEERDYNSYNEEKGRME